MAENVNNGDNYLNISSNKTINHHEDIFESITMAEESFQMSGFSEGLKRGQEHGYLGGYKLGHQHGAQLGSELGFYSGFAETWLSFLNGEKDQKPRKIKAVNTLLNLIDNFPMDEPENPSLQEKMLEIRAKFKQVCSLLNIVIDNNGAKSQAGISF